MNVLIFMSYRRKKVIGKVDHKKSNFLRGKSKSISKAVALEASTAKAA